MYEILAALDASAVVLDLGCAKGSFRRTATSATTIRLDRHIESVRGEISVQADAARLPFRDKSLHAIVAHHSLEHFEDLENCLREIGRVIRPDGALFVSVPDASTLTDKLYRWLANGGGHVNRFVDPEEVVHAVRAATGLEHLATRTLYSSLSFLNPRNSPRPRPRRLVLLGGGREWSLLLYTWFSRRVDRILNTRTSVLGWAFYFGTVSATIDITPSPNVCIRCGSGVATDELMRDSRVRRMWWGPLAYSCPYCGATNSFVSA